MHFAARAAPRLETRLPLAARSESMMFVRLARFAGIHTDTSTVTNVSTEAAANTQPFTATRKATSPEPASWEMAGPSAAKVAAHPARTDEKPTGDADDGHDGPFQHHGPAQLPARGAHRGQKPKLLDALGHRDVEGVEDERKRTPRR